MLTLGITYWAARRTKTTAHFYAAGHSITGFQNGLALAGDYMSAASFHGIAGLVALNGFDGLIYAPRHLGTAVYIGRGHPVPGRMSGRSAAMKAG